MRRVFEEKISGSSYLPEYDFLSKRHTEGLLTPLLNGPWFYPRPVAKCPYAKHWSLMPIHGEFFSQLVKGCPLINYACSYLRFKVCFIVNSAASIGPTEDWNTLPLDSVDQNRASGSQWGLCKSLTIGRVMWWSVAQRMKTPHITERTDERSKRFKIERLLWCGNLTLLQL